MVKKVSRIQKHRENLRAWWDGSTLGTETRLLRLHRFVHFWVMVWVSFTRNRCPARASALAYGTLLALIPMLAVIVSVTSSLLKKEGEERIDQFITNLVSSVTSSASEGTNAVAAVSGQATNAVNAADEPAANPEPPTSGGTTNETALTAFAKQDAALEARKSMARYIHGFIQNTRSAALGLTGSILLIFVAISLLSQIEDTFNDIWGVARGRSWFMRVVLYWGVITLAPMLLVVALGLATGPQLESTKKLLTTMPFVSNLMFQFLPVVVLCLTFALVYMLMPNTKVHLLAALMGGAVSGILFHLNNLVSVLYVSRVVSNSKIYGSLGLVPVFMIGLYFSWWILLFGAQVAYAFQNRKTYLEEKQIENINQRGREFIALRLMTCVGQRFGAGAPPANVVEISEELGVPTRLVRQIMRVLSSARLIVETAGAEPAYLPARPLETITCYDILLAMRAAHGQELATRDEPTRVEVYGEFQRIQEAERQAAASVTMLALVNRAGQRKLTE